VYNVKARQALNRQVVTTRLSFWRCASHSLARMDSRKPLTVKPQGSLMFAQGLSLLCVCWVCRWVSDDSLCLVTPLAVFHWVAIPPPFPTPTG
jgi:hypothetical protein